MKKHFSILAIIILSAVMTGCEGYQDPPNQILVGIEVIEINDHDVVTHFVPNIKASSYEYAIGTVHDLAAFTDGTLQGIMKQQDTNSLTYNFTNYDGAELKSLTDYYIMARCYDTEGNPSPVCKKEIKTTMLKGKIEASVISVSETQISVLITPGSNTKKFSYALGGALDYDDFSNGVMEGIVTVNAVDVVDSNPILTTLATFTGLTPGTKYVLYMKAIFDDATTTGVVAIEIETIEVTEVP